MCTSSTFDSQHVAIGWPNACNMLRPTMLQSLAFKCCDRLARALTIPSLPHSSGFYFVAFNCTFQKEMLTPPFTLLEVLSFRFLKLLLSSSSVFVQVPVSHAVNIGKAMDYGNIDDLGYFIWSFLIGYIKAEERILKNFRFLILFKSFGTYNFKLFF